MGYLARTPIGFQPMIGAFGDTEEAAAAEYRRILTDWTKLLKVGSICPYCEQPLLREGE